MSSAFINRYGEIVTYNPVEVTIPMTLLEDILGMARHPAEYRANVVDFVADVLGLEFEDARTARWWPDHLRDTIQVVIYPLINPVEEEPSAEASALSKHEL